MTVPLIGIGHDLLLNQLVPFYVEPAIPNGVTYAQRDVAADGSIHLQGLHCVLAWDLFESSDDLHATLEQMALDDDSDTRSAVTAYLPTMRGQWHVYNGYANAPVAIRYQLWPQGISVMLNRLILTDAGVG